MHEAVERVAGIVDAMEAENAQLRARVAELTDQAALAAAAEEKRREPVPEEKRPLTGDPQSRIEALEDENDKLRGELAAMRAEAAEKPAKGKR